VTSEHSLKIGRLRERLCQIVEPDFGLLNQLFSAAVITDRDRQMIKAGEYVYDRNDRLLHCLSSSELTETQHRDLLSALDDTSQPHVANFIRGDGGLTFGLSCCSINISQSISQ